MIGGGKYEKQATEVREATGAEAVVVLVLGGVHGSGFSVQMTDPNHMGALADVLERVAEEIRRGQS